MPNIFEKSYPSRSDGPSLIISFLTTNKFYKAKHFFKLKRYMINEYRKENHETLYDIYIYIYHIHMFVCL